MITHLDQGFVVGQIASKNSHGARINIRDRQFAKPFLTGKERTSGFLRGDIAIDGERQGRLDILVNNAGDIPTGTLESIDSTTWRQGWDLKVFGYVDLTRVILPRMQARKSGVVVNVIGAAGESANPNYVAGCMGNASLTMFTECLGGESVRHGVRVVGVNPGPTMSDHHLAHVKERAEKRFGDANRYLELEAQRPSGRSSTVEKIADAVAFFASDRSSHNSGTTLRIDGGVRAHYWR